MKLLFDNTPQSSDLHHFPVLVVLNPAMLLDYEIELWDPAENSYI
jgi:hypothetical protein